MVRSGATVFFIRAAEENRTGMPSAGLPWLRRARTGREARGYPFPLRTETLPGGWLAKLTMFLGARKGEMRDQSCFCYPSRRLGFLLVAAAATRGGDIR